MGRPTLVSLAEELGVSRQTVSNVINAPHLVRPETRERVQAAIEASGYRPHVAAQALRRQRSQTLAMRVYPTVDGGINGAVMDRFLHHVAVAVHQGGYRLMLVTADSFDDEVRLLSELHRRGTIDGCILTDSHAGDTRQERLVAAELPTATFGRPWDDEEDFGGLWVDVDGFAGTRMATEELLGRGYERIGFLGWPEGSEVGADRRGGWADAMADAGITGIEDWQAGGDDRMESGLDGMDELLAKGVEAVVCASDSLAVGALEAMRRAGRLDRDVAPIIGFDNTPVARALGLSSIDQPVEQAAERLCDLLLPTLAGRGESDLGLELLEPELVVRSLGLMYGGTPDPADA